MKSGAVHVYYYWDGRGRGLKEINLGKDRQKAIEAWALCEKGVLPEKKDPKLSKIMRTARPKSRRSLISEEWLSAESWVRTMYFNAERRAKKARKAFTLTPIEMLELVKLANGACQISGIPFEQTKEKSPFAPSLDRIDSCAGYEKGNVRLVSHVANVAMNTWGIEPVLRLAKAIIAPTTL